MFKWSVEQAGLGCRDGGKCSPVESRTLISSKKQPLLPGSLPEVAPPVGAPWSSIPLKFLQTNFDHIPITCGVAMLLSLTGLRVPSVNAPSMGPWRALRATGSVTASAAAEQPGAGDGRALPLQYKAGQGRPEPEEQGELRAQSECAA